jgi:hypothetical protein
LVRAASEVATMLAEADPSQRLTAGIACSGIAESRAAESRLVGTLVPKQCGGAGCDLVAAGFAASAYPIASASGR